MRAAAAVTLLLAAGCVGDLIDPKSLPSDDRVGDVFDDRGDPSAIGYAEGGSPIATARAGTLDLGGDPPPPTAGTLDCATATGLLLCDDFEGGVLDRSVWSESNQNGGEVSIDDTTTFQGAHAVRMRVPVGSGIRAAIRTEAIFPVANEHFFGRLYVYLSPEIPEVHSYLIKAAGPLDGQTAQYRLDSNSGRLNSRYTHPTVPEHGGYKKLSYPMPVERWLCIEWEYDGDNDAMRYWMDGELVDDLVVTGDEDPVWTAPETFESLEIGWHDFQSAAVVTDVWYDAIALSTERIGCR